MLSGSITPLCRKATRVLTVEEGHVAVELEELPAHGLAGQRQPLDHAPREKMLADDLVQVGLAGDAVEDLVGPDEDVRKMAGLLAPADAEATGRLQGRLVLADRRGAELLGQNCRETAVAPFQPQRTLPQINSS